MSRTRKFPRYAAVQSKVVRGTAFGDLVFHPTTAPGNPEAEHPSTPAWKTGSWYSTRSVSFDRREQKSSPSARTCATRRLCMTSLYSWARECWRRLGRICYLSRELNAARTSPMRLQPLQSDKKVCAFSNPTNSNLIIRLRRAWIREIHAHQSLAVSAAIRWFPLFRAFAATSL